MPDTPMPGMPQPPAPEMPMPPAGLQPQFAPQIVPGPPAQGQMSMPGQAGPMSVPGQPTERVPHRVALRVLKAEIAQLVQQHQAELGRQQQRPPVAPPAARDQPGGDALPRFGGVPGITVDYAARPDSASNGLEMPAPNRLLPPELQPRAGMEAQGGHTDYRSATTGGGGFRDPETGGSLASVRTPGFNAQQTGPTPARIADGSAGPRSIAEAGHVNALWENEDHAGEAASASKQGMAGPGYRMPPGGPLEVDIRKPDVLDTAAQRARLGEAGFNPDLVPYEPERAYVRPGELPSTPWGRSQAEIRNTNEPVAEWVGQHINPLLGHRVQQFSDVGRALEETPGIGQIVRTGEELTGTPAMTRGALDIRRGLEEGDPWRTAGGAAQMGVGAIPGASGVRALRPALGSVPGVLATGGLAGAASALPAYAEEVKMKTPKQKAFEDIDKRRENLQSQINTIMAEPPPAAPQAKQLSRRLTPQQMEAQGKAGASAYGAVVTAHQESLKARAAPLQTQLDALKPDWDQARKDMVEEQQSDLPLRQRYPGATASLSAVPYVLPSLAAARMGYKAADNINREVRAYRAATAATPMDVDAANRARDMLRNYQDESIWRHPRSMGALMGGTALGTMAIEAMPEVLDSMTGSPTAQQHARDKLSDWKYWAYERGLPAAVSSTGMPMIGHATAEAVTGGTNRGAARTIVRSPPVTPPTTPPGGGNNQPVNILLGPHSWPPQAQAAANRYVAGRLGNPAAVNALTTADINAALLAEGITPAATGRNIETRLQGTKDMINQRAAAGNPVTTSDLVARRNATFNGRKILSVGPAAAAGTALSSGDFPEGNEEPHNYQDTGTQSRIAPRATSTALPTSRQGAPSQSLPSGHSETPWGVRGPDGRFTRYPR